MEKKFFSPHIPVRIEDFTRGSKCCCFCNLPKGFGQVETIQADPSHSWKYNHFYLRKSEAVNVVPRTVVWIPFTQSLLPLTIFNTLTKSR